MFKKWRSKHKGFTLVELVVVLAILMMLVLMVTPKFLGYTAKAHVAVAKSNARTVMNAATLYQNENPDKSGHLGEKALAPFLQKTKGSCDYQVNISSEGDIQGEVVTKKIRVRLPDLEVLNTEEKTEK